MCGRFLLIAAVYLCLSASVFGQFDVKLEVTAKDQELKTKITALLTDALSKLQGVKIGGTGKLEVKAEAIKRTVSEGTSDYFLSIISTSKTHCVVSRDARGRVDSTTECWELLSSSTYAGRENELARMVSDFTKMYDSYVIGPLRP